MEMQAPERAPRRLWGLTSWLLNQNAQQAHRVVMEQVAAAGMRKQHFAVLAAIDELGSPSQSELVRTLAIDGSDMVALLNELAAAGLVERRRDETDRRRNLMGLTPAGEEALAVLAARMDTAQDVLLAPLDDDEREQLRTLLTRVLEHHRGRAAEARPAAAQAAAPSTSNKSV
jgi:DNA-binding MarR family transcriptional regulator